MKCFSLLKLNSTRLRRRKRFSESSFPPSRVRRSEKLNGMFLELLMTGVERVNENCYRLVTISSLQSTLHICEGFTQIVPSRRFGVIFSHNGVRNLSSSSLGAHKTSSKRPAASSDTTLLYYNYIKGLWVFRITRFLTRYHVDGLSESVLCLFYDIGGETCIVSSLKEKEKIFQAENSLVDNPIVAA
jgi:hypothetical protein